MQELKFSIITVCYNAAETIEKTTLSVRNQSYHNFEHIIIDGSSTDGTLDIIKKYRDGFSVVTSEPDKGIYDAMNKGITLTKGKYLLMLNSGDCIYRDTLNEVYSIIKNRNYPPYIAGCLDIVDKKNSIIKKRQVDLLSSKFYMSVGHQALFVRSDMHIKYGMYDTRYKIVSDYEFVSRLIENEKSGIAVKGVFGSFLDGGVSGVNNHDNEIISVWGEKFKDYLSRSEVEILFEAMFYGTQYEKFELIIDRLLGEGYDKFVALYYRAVIARKSFFIESRKMKVLETIMSLLSKKKYRLLLNICLGKK